MGLDQKRWIIAVLGVLFLASLVLVQGFEINRREAEMGLRKVPVSIPATSRDCVDCHGEETRGLVAHWEDSEHARVGVGCADCHEADPGDADAFDHYGVTIATVTTPRDCGRCHPDVATEFEKSHHSAAGNILHSLDNFLAETVEGSRVPFAPHSPTPGLTITEVNGLASAFSGCQQCHGSKLALQSTDGGRITVDELAPDAEGHPTNLEVAAMILRDDHGRPLFDPETWPNTGIGRLNLDGSRGSCSACHSRHDFSPRRARQPENCGKCHLGPDHPQKEIYEESKHGVAYRDRKDAMNLDASSWVLGEDYDAAPTCATCHMSANTRNGKRITHDPAERLSWNNRPPISLVMDTNAEGKIVTTLDPEQRRAEITDTAAAKRTRMKNVCSHCHTPDFVNAFYTQYDNLVILYNEKFAKPGRAIIGALGEHGMITSTQFDDEIEWTWFYLWHHEGRRARHGVSMMAPDYTHWHGMYEVAERFYVELIPQARELTEEAREHGHHQAADAVDAVIDGILERPEHQWFERGAAEESAAIQAAMRERYGDVGESASDTEDED